MTIQRQKKKTLAFASAALVVGALSVGLASPAGAASGSPVSAGAGSTDTAPGQVVAVQTVPMHIESWDPAVAQANGYVLAKDALGRLTPTKAGQAPASTASLDASADAVVTPYGTVYGNCGTSSAFLTAHGEDKYTVDTGFSVSPSAVHYNWVAHVYGPGYDHTFTWGGGLLFRSTWTGSGNGTTPWPAWQSLFVSGKALLSNGATCVSGNPTDLEYVY